MQTSTIAVDHGVVLDNIYAFLLDHGYVHTLRALQLESKRPFTLLVEASANASDGNLASGLLAEGGATTRANATPNSSDHATISSAGLRQSILSGRWDDVLSKYLVHCTLPQELLFQLYEHVFQEMLHVFQLEPAARTLFMHSPVFKTMKRRSPAQHTRLAQMLEAFKPAASTHYSAGAAASGSLNVADVTVPAAFAAQRCVLAEDMCRVLRFVDKHTAHKMNRLPWLVAADAASLLLPPTADTSASHQERVDDGAAGGGSPATKKCRREASTAEEQPQQQQLSTTMAEAMMGQAAECPLLPKAISRQCSFASPEDPGETVTSCRCTTLRRGDGSVGSGIGGPVVAVTKTNGSVALYALEGDALVDPLVHFTGGAPLCTDFDAAESGSTAAGGLTDEVLDCWLAVGYRGGAVRIYDCNVRKLVRKIEAVDALGVHHLTFCGSSNAIRGHRGILLAATLSGALVLLSLEQGAVLKSIAAAHNGGHILSVARCVLTPSHTAASTTPDNGRTLEVFVTAGDDGTLRQWSCSSDAGTPASPRLGSAGAATLQPYPTGSTTQTVAKPMPLGQLHPLLEGTMASMACGVVLAKRCAAAQQGGDLLAVATRCGKVVVYSLSMMLPLVACALDNGVASMDVITTSTTAGGGGGGATSAAVGCLLVATDDGLVHAFRFDSQLHAGKKACTRSEPDATSTVVAEAVGGKVAGLVVSASWDAALGTRRGAFAVCSPDTKTLFVVGGGRLEREVAAL